jgi:hypothetical protein
VVSAVCRRLSMLAAAARESRSHPFLHVVIITAAAAATENIASKTDNNAAARAAVASSITASMSV